MNIIKNIEIRYFRSTHRIKLRNLRDLNVFSGRNDVGKSNILKALNLFFNGETDWQEDLDFYKDFSKKRLSEVRKNTIKGKQFISIAIEFKRPESYKGSLPTSFMVTRTWHRDGIIYSESNNLDVLNKKNKLPSTLDTAKRFLPIFLNRVHFEYIPAVKDRPYFEHILSRLQKALLDIQTGTDSTISDTAGNLATHIQAKIVRLHDDFKRATGISSSVVPPSEFASLFQAFVVSTHVGEELIPLAQRGDGIQARYVPSVLSYICGNSRDFFVWGFEEPENSLEFTHVTALANDFQKLYSKVAQIFLTTHSPAFTTIKTDSSTCFRVFRTNTETSEVGVIWPESGSATERTRLNIDMGFFKLQEKLHEDYINQSEQLKTLNKNIETIKEESRQLMKPIVYLEGKHDRKIIESAWEKIRPSSICPFIFRFVDPTGGIAGGGAGGARALIHAIESVHPEEGKKEIAIFDRDHEGVDCFKKLSNNFTVWNDHEDIKIHANGFAFAVLLPIPSGREKYAEKNNLMIEYYFTDEILIRRTSNNRGLKIETPRPRLLIGKTIVPYNPNQFTLSLDGFQEIKGGKDIFANEIVPLLNPADFSAFRPLFYLLLEIIA